MQGDSIPWQLSIGRENGKQLTHWQLLQLRLPGVIGEIFHPCLLYLGLTLQNFACCSNRVAGTTDSGQEQLEAYGRKKIQEYIFKAEILFTRILNCGKAQFTNWQNA